MLRIYVVGLCACLALLMVGCAPAAPPADRPSRGQPGGAASTPTVSVPPTSAPVAPTATPTSAAPPTPTGDMGGAVLGMSEAERNLQAGSPEAALVELARADLQRRLSTRAPIALKSCKPTEFSDTSLGVREPGRMYAQVIMPGFIMQLSAEGGLYTYHGAGGRVVYVSGGRE